MSHSIDACRYRITLGPRGGVGSFRLQTIVTLSMDLIVSRGEMTCLVIQADEAARSLLGRDCDALTAVRVEREFDGAWHERRWPIPVAATISDLTFSPAGDLLTNVTPTWPA